MLRNCVLDVSVNTRKWFHASAIRAVKTICQTAVAGIGTTSLMGSVDWKLVASTSILAGIVSLLTSVAGIPEVGPEQRQKT